jgi:serine/threonine protein kinase
MGRVFVAEHVRLGRRVALKVLLPQYSGRPDAVERFFREARAVNRIGHENIVEVTDDGIASSGEPYFVMELLNGLTLAARLKGEGRGGMALPRALHIMLQVVDALAASHAEGIIHRDLKPDNIFLIRRQGDHDYVKLLDFGIAKLLADERGRVDALTKTGMAMGTPYYMSPEQCRGRNIDHRTDIYSVGILLFEILTGERPFEADNYHALLAMHVEDPFPSIRRHRPDLPAALEAVVARAVAKAPDDRWPSMNDMAVALRQLLPSGRVVGESITLPLVSPVWAGVPRSTPAGPPETGSTPSSMASDEWLGPDDETELVGEEGNPGPPAGSGDGSSIAVDLGTLDAASVADGGPTPEPMVVRARRPAGGPPAGRRSPGPSQTSSPSFLSGELSGAPMPPPTAPRGRLLYAAGGGVAVLVVVLALWALARPGRTSGGDSVVHRAAPAGEARVAADPVTRSDAAGPPPPAAAPVVKPAQPEVRPAAQVTGAAAAAPDGSAAQAVAASPPVTSARAPAAASGRGGAGERAWPAALKADPASRRLRAGRAPHPSSQRSTSLLDLVDMAEEKLPQPSVAPPAPPASAKGKAGPATAPKPARPAGTLDRLDVETLE